MIILDAPDVSLQAKLDTVQTEPVHILVDSEEMRYVNDKVRYFDPSTTPTKLNNTTAIPILTLSGLGRARNVPEISVYNPNAGLVPITFYLKAGGVSKKLKRWNMASGLNLEFISDHGWRATNGCAHLKLADRTCTFPPPPPPPLTLCDECPNCFLLEVGGTIDDTFMPCTDVILDCTARFKDQRVIARDSNSRCNWDGPRFDSGLEDLPVLHYPAPCQDDSGVGYSQYGWYMLPSSSIAQPGEYALALIRSSPGGSVTTQIWTTDDDVCLPGWHNFTLRFQVAGKECDFTGATLRMKPVTCQLCGPCALSDVPDCWSLAVSSDFTVPGPWSYFNQYAGQTFTLHHNPFSINSCGWTTDLITTALPGGFTGAYTWQLYPSLPGDTLNMGLGIWDPSWGLPRAAWPKAKYDWHCNDTNTIDASTGGQPAVTSPATGTLTLTPVACP